MHISIDTTEPVSDLDRSILSMLVGGELVAAEVAQAAPAAKKAEPEAKPAAKKAAAKKAKPEPEPEPEPEPTPEPMAEEPVEDEPVEEDDTEEQSDEDLLALAVKKATEMVAGGEAAKVREALDAAGASRVRELNKDNVRDFFKALS